MTEFWCLNEGFPVNVKYALVRYKTDNVYINISTTNKLLQKGLHRAIFSLMNDDIYYVNILLMH
jgi:hypothetical protein